MTTTTSSSSPDNTKVEEGEFTSIIHPTTSRPQHQTQRSLSRVLTHSTILSERRSRRQYDDSESEAEQDEAWDLPTELQKVQDQARRDNQKAKRLGVTWTNLTVKGVGADAAVQDNFGSQFNFMNGVRDKRAGPQLKTLLDNSHGCVKPGEMLLVLGRPGSGCTTLLKMLANRREGYAEVNGNMHWGSMDEKEAGKYRGQIVMNTEEELFFPTLTVGQTIDFATRMKVPENLPGDINDPVEYQRKNRDFFLKSMGIAHTSDTKVGDEFVRGVSGGERYVALLFCSLIYLMSEARSVSRNWG